jgi:hypothetical protein
MEKVKGWLEEMFRRFGRMMDMALSRCCEGRDELYLGRWDEMGGGIRVRTCD